MEFILEHLKDWKVLYKDETANLAMEERHIIQGDEPELAIGFNKDALPIYSREDYLHGDARSTSNIVSMESQERASVRASINTAWIKLNEYYTLLGRSLLFAASVVLNLNLGLRWLETNWTSPDQLQWLRDAKDGIKAYFERWYSKNDDDASETILATSSLTPRPEQSRFEQWVKSRQPKLSATGSELERVQARAGAGE
ncbi:hypothetical protein HZ326_27731 [Fusarium oxysporum f. sp. albedinis]|nr:hypothetical protein HZ326_27731 [Fusarium oxysporum f. sp. albedinis]